MKCEKCDYVFYEKEEDYFLCPNCFELIEENLPNDKRKRVNLYTTSSILKNNHIDIYNNISKFLNRLPIYCLFLYIIVYRGNLRLSRIASSNVFPDFYRAITSIFFIVFFSLMILTVVSSHVNRLITVLFYDVESPFFVLIINLSINMLVYFLFLFKFFDLFKYFLNFQLLYKNYDNTPKDVLWHINFNNGVFFIFMIIFFLARCYDSLLIYYKYSKITKLQKELLDEFSD